MRAVPQINSYLSLLFFVVDIGKPNCTQNIVALVNPVMSFAAAILNFGKPL